MGSKIRRKNLTRIVSFLISIIVLCASVLMNTKMTSADQFDDQINALQQQINAYNDQTAQLVMKEQTLQTAIDNLQKQADYTQTQINLSQVQYDQLTIKINDTQNQIKTNQDALGEVVATIYVDDSVTPIELLASSKNIGDYIDKQTYRASVRDKLVATIDKIQQLKNQLSKERADVESVMNKQKAQKANLVNIQNQQQALLDQTRGQEAAYQSMIADARQQMENEAAAQRSYYQSLIQGGNSGVSGAFGSFVYSNWSGNMGCSGGYPYCGPQDTTVDPWGLYNRECVSYVAWALSARFHKYVGNFGGQGNAYQWPYSAPAYSGATRVYSPQPGDAVILPQSGSFSPIGHAMIVESVSGGTMHVSQYNFYGTGEYSTMDLQNSGVILLRFPNQ